MSLYPNDQGNPAGAIPVYITSGSSSNSSYIVDGTGNTVLSTANGTFYTSAISPSYKECQVYVEFYSDAAGTIPATPTAGTVSVWASPMGNNYLAAGNVSTINATACSTPTSTYTPPMFIGQVSKGKITFAGITGAGYAKVLFAWGV